MARAGQRRSLVSIETPAGSKSSTGAKTASWVEFKQVYAKIKTMRTYEKQAAQAANPGANVMIRIKYIAGLLPTMRIVYNSTIYSILGINDIDERHRDVEFTCQSGVKAQ